MKIHDKIKSLRLEKEWTLKDFSEAVHSDEETVKKWEEGELVPSLYQAMDIAKAFDCSLDDLLEETTPVVEEEKEEEIVEEPVVQVKKQHPLKDMGMLKTFILMFIIGAIFVALTIGNMNFLVVMLPVILIIIYIAVIAWLIYSFIKVRKIKKNNGK